MRSSEKVAEIYRKQGISQASFYTWKKQYAGMGACKSCASCGNCGRKTAV